MYVKDVKEVLTAQKVSVCHGLRFVDTEVRGVGLGWDVYVQSLCSSGANTHYRLPTLEVTALQSIAQLYL